MRAKRYRVTVKAVDHASVETTVGSIVLDAADREAAHRAAMQKLWTKELEQSGAKPLIHAERITGEGG